MYFLQHMLVFVNQEYMWVAEYINEYYVYEVVWVKFLECSCKKKRL